MFKSKITLIFLTAIFIFSVLKIEAQEDFYRVYEYETPLEGHVEVTAWNTYIADSRQDLDFSTKL